jgi:cell division septal protein FtsQ
VDQAHVRKVFPSTLRIQIKERSPAVRIKKDRTYLLDEQGVQLIPPENEDFSLLPLLVDKNNFQQDEENKLNLAWACLEDLDKNQRALIRTMDLSRFNVIIIELRESSPRLILGHEGFSGKLNFFLKNRHKLDEHGPLEYVDLRFEDRVYIKKSIQPGEGGV